MHDCMTAEIAKALVHVTDNVVQSTISDELADVSQATVARLRSTTHPPACAQRASIALLRQVPASQLVHPSMPVGLPPGRTV